MAVTPQPDWWPTATPSEPPPASTPRLPLTIMQSVQFRNVTRAGDQLIASWRRLNVPASDDILRQRARERYEGDA